jgi:hypothetical protein
MQVRTVQALVVVLDDELPVRAHVVDDSPSEPQILHLPGSELAGKIGELVDQRRRRWRQVQEDVSGPFIRGHTLKWIVPAGKVRHLVHVRRADQLSVQVVRPRVVGTLDGAVKDPLGLRADACSSMPAHVEERVHHPRGITRDDDALPEEIADEI